MKTKLLSLLLLILLSARVFAQDFYGYVKKADSLSSPIFQAKVEITEGDKPFNTLKTYFDGSFKFAPNKSQTYQVKISYSGYVDTAYSFTTDKKGIPSAQNVTVKLKKDGMRLLGVIRSREENFPVEGATIILKNVMTRKEDRITTGINGAYNFKLEFETNYRISLDKRSPGIINKFRDTTFYISTVGFNLPLDYKLDIYLNTDLYPNTTVRDGYEPNRQPENKNLKPAINASDSKPDTIRIQKQPANSENKQPFKEQDEKLKGAQEIISKLQEELEKTQKELEKAKRKKETTADSNAKNSKNKKGTDPAEVVIIRDTLVSKPPDKDRKTESKNAALEETRAKATETRQAEANKPDTIKSETGLGTKGNLKQTKPILQPDTLSKGVGAPTDSVNRATLLPKKIDTGPKTEPDTLVPNTIKNSVKKAQEKNTYQPKSQEELIAAAEAFARQKQMAQDSIARNKALQEKLIQEQKKKK